MRGSELIDEPLVSEPVPPDPEVLIEEARRRTRRRRIRHGVLLASGVAAALVGLLLARAGSSAALPAITPHSPLRVDVRAFRGHGTLAFVSKGSLYVLDGAGGRVVHIADPGHTASDPMLSRDGRWLAYLEEFDPDNPGYQLWIARPDGSDAHQISSIRNAQIVGWSPSADVLAVIDKRSADATCKSGQATSVDLLTPPSGLRTVYTVRNAICRNPKLWSDKVLYGAVWSPNGRALAVATTAFNRGDGSMVFSIDLRTGVRRTWFAARNSPGTCSGCGPEALVADLAGWWPRWGIGFWAFHSDGILLQTSDGSPLDFVRAPGATPRNAGTTLSDGTQTAVAVSSTGDLALVHAPWRDIALGGSALGGTEVQTCAAGTLRCAAVPGASVWNRAVTFSCRPTRSVYCAKPLKPGARDSGVTLDPAWSPDGSLLAYVRGPAVPQDSDSTAQWLAYHHLFLYDARTRTTRELPGTTGASAPQWSADGSSMLYVARDSLWLLDLKTERSALIAGPLFGGRSFASTFAGSFYHQVPFTAQFGWRS